MHPHVYGDTFSHMSNRAFRLRIKRWQSNVDALRYAVESKDRQIARDAVNAPGFRAERERLLPMLAEAEAGLRYWQHHAQQAGAIPAMAAA